MRACVWTLQGVDPDSLTEQDVLEVMQLPVGQRISGFGPDWRNTLLALCLGAAASAWKVQQVS